MCIKKKRRRFSRTIDTSNRRYCANKGLQNGGTLIVAQKVFQTKKYDKNCFLFDIPLFPLDFSQSPQDEVSAKKIFKKNFLVLKVELLLHLRATICFVFTDPMFTKCKSR